LGVTAGANVTGVNSIRRSKETKSQCTHNRVPTIQVVLSNMPTNFNLLARPPIFWFEAFPPGR
jgi:hypothetical protein